MARPQDPKELAEFQAFVEVHADFGEALMRHQEALVRGDARAGREILARLRMDLEDHIRRENTKILPVIEERGGCESARPRMRWRVIKEA